MGRLPYHVDAALYAYPDRWINREAFLRGLLPLWNPYIGCGTPHLANWVSAVFYPPFWLFNLTGLANWFMGMAAAHAALAFAGCFLWLRAQKAAPLWCALGALSFAGSAHLTCCWANLTFITTAAWIPWVFWATLRALNHPTFPNWSLAGLFLGFLALAGYPFFLFYTVLFLIPWVESLKPPAASRAGFWLTLVATALATSLQWFPFLDLLTYARHSPWTPYPYFDRPSDYLTLLKPDALGVPGTTAYQGLFPNTPFNLYFGLIPLAVLTLNGLYLARLKNRFWTLSALVWLLWMAGDHSLFGRLFPVGWLEWMEPSKAVGLFLFSAVTSVTLSLHSLFKSGRPSANLTALAACLLLAWCLDLGRLPFLLFKPMHDPYPNAALMETAAKVQEEARGGRLLSLHRPSEWSFTGDASRVLGRTVEKQVGLFLANSNAVWGIRSADRYLFLQVDGSENLVRYYNRGFPYPDGLLDLAGVSLFLLPQALPAPHYQVLGKLDKDFLVLNRKFSPDLRWVPGKADFPDRPAILETLTRPDGSWENKVDLEKKPDGSHVRLEPVSRAFPERPPTSREAGRASFVFPQASPRPGYLVFNETFAPGWHAWVDGKPSPILRAYGLFMAVPVEAGGHQVDFRYEPASFRLGLFLSFLALAFWMGAFLSWKR